MNRTVVTTVMVSLLTVVMVSGAFAKADPPFNYAFVDTNGDGVYTEGVDVPAIVTHHDAADGSWIEISVPSSVVGVSTSSTGPSTPTLVFPAKTQMSLPKGTLFVSAPGVVQIGPGVHMHASSIQISGAGLTVGANAQFTTTGSGDVTIDVGDGGLMLNGARFDTTDLTIYVGVDSGDGVHGALVADDVMISTETLTIGTKEGISLTNSTVRFTNTKKSLSEPEASLTTNFDPFSENPPYPVDLSGTTFVGPAKLYYFVDVYGSPVNTDGVKWKGGAHDLFVAP